MRAPPALDAARTACQRKGWPLRLAPWRTRQQAQKRENLFHPQGLDPRPGESGYRDNGVVDTNVCTDKRMAWSSPARQVPEAPACIFTL
jgi:hypothetical protein